VDSRGLRLNVGLRSLDVTEWFEFDDQRSAQLVDKLELMATKRHDVLAMHAAGVEPALELWDLALDNLEEHHRSRFLVSTNLRGQRTVFDHEVKQSVSLVDFLNPLEGLGRLLQEDICILSRKDNGWVLVGAVLCAPSRWKLTEKMGQNVMGIHQPVPHYEQSIGDAVDFTMDRMTPDRPVFRFNWTLVDDEALYQPEVVTRSHFDDDSIANEVFFRVERQTLRRLPRTDAIVFTIRSYVHSVAHICDEVPEARALLLNALQTADPETISYKNWHLISPLLQEWLNTAG
jgi:hypothetical protein